MNVVKADALRLIETLPDDCTYEEIHYHLYVRQKVERGIESLEAGEVVPQVVAEREVQEWLVSTGLAQPSTM